MATNSEEVRQAALRERARRELERRRSQEPEQPEQNPLLTAGLALLDPRARGELASQVLTGAVSTPLAGLRGIAAAIPGGQSPVEAVQETQEALTFQPRLPQGQLLAQAVGKPFELLERGADLAGELSGDPEDVLGATAVKTALLGAPMALGFRGGRPAPRTPRQQVAANAQQSGYVVDPAATNTGIRAGVLEGAGGKLKTQQVAAVRNQQVTNDLAARSVGLPEGVPITREALSSVRAQAADSFRALERAGQITTDTVFRRDVSNAMSSIRRAQRDFPRTTKGANDLVKIAEEISNTQQFDAGSAIAAMRLLRDSADDAFRNGRGQQGKAYRGLSDALEDAIERDLIRQTQSGTLPQGQLIVENFRNARQRIAKTHSIEDALEGFEVSAPKLAAQLRRGRPLSAELKQIAEFADQFPKITRTMREAVPQFSPLDIWTGLASGGAGVATGNLALLAPAVFSAARPAIRNLSLSRPGQNLAIQPQITGGRLPITEQIIASEIANQ